MTGRISLSSQREILTPTDASCKDVENPLQDLVGRTIQNHQNYHLTFKNLRGRVVCDAKDSYTTKKNLTLLMANSSYPLCPSILLIIRYFLIKMLLY